MSFRSSGSAGRVVSLFLVVVGVAVRAAFALGVIGVTGTPSLEGTEIRFGDVDETTTDLVVPAVGTSPTRPV